MLQVRHRRAAQFGRPVRPRPEEPEHEEGRKSGSRPNLDADAGRLGSEGKWHVVRRCVQRSGGCCQCLDGPALPHPPMPTRACTTQAHRKFIAKRRRVALDATASGRSNPKLTKNRKSRSMNTTTRNCAS
ncbi:hypothetical protein B0H13DRAFT_1877009 [Mycena leptocephala]|nr:hypothetical protein B0H13DRAFT_1877009 [Mycena leptocephala]